MYAIDIGANLTDEVFSDDLSAVIERARRKEIEIILTGTTLHSSKYACELSQKFNLYCTAGIHPHYVNDIELSEVAKLRSLLENPKVVAMGEMGLDFFRNFSPPQKQEAIYIAQLELASIVQKPLFLHDRETNLRTLEILKMYRDKILRSVIHCFTGDKAALKQWLDFGSFVGVTGWLTDLKRGQELREAVRYIPVDRLMIETDAPFLLPKNIPKHIKSTLKEKRRNEPYFLTYVLEELAQLRSEPLEELRVQLLLNTKNFFNL